MDQGTPWSLTIWMMEYTRYHPSGQYGAWLRSYADGGVSEADVRQRRQSRAGTTARGWRDSARRGQRTLLPSAAREPNGTQIWVRFMDGDAAPTQITRLTETPADAAWSPDGMPASPSGRATGRRSCSRRSEPKAPSTRSASRRSPVELPANTALPPELVREVTDEGRQGGGAVALGSRRRFGLGRRRRGRLGLRGRVGLRFRG